MCATIFSRRLRIDLPGDANPIGSSILSAQETVFNANVLDAVAYGSETWLPMKAMQIRWRWRKERWSGGCLTRLSVTILISNSTSDGDVEDIVMAIRDSEILWGRHAAFFADNWWTESRITELYPRKRPLDRSSGIWCVYMSYRKWRQTAQKRTIWNSCSRHFSNIKTSTMNARAIWWHTYAYRYILLHQNHVAT